MKNILVPTDFSHNAKIAFEAGLALAEMHNAKLHLYTLLDLPDDWKNLSIYEQEKFPEALQTIHNAELLFKEWEKIAASKNVDILSLWSSGNLKEEIDRFRKLYDVDFIVMGSHGASGKNEFFIGSNTQKIVRTVHCPVLIIKEELKNYRFKKVVFASNFDEKEKIAFQYFLDFVKGFDPEIHLVQINTTSFFSEPYYLVKEAMKDFVTMSAPLKTHSHFYRDFNVDSGIRHLTNEIGAELIAVSNQTRRPLKRMLIGSNVEALVNHANVPVLSIDFPKK